MSNKASVGDDAESQLGGVAYLLLGIGLFSVQDVIIKDLSGSYAAHEIVFLRGVVALVPLIFIVLRAGGAAAFRMNRPVLVLLRGLIGFCCYTTYYMGLTILTLADATTLFFANPLFVTALSVPLLREAVGLRRWLAVAVGFLGVVVVLRPDGPILEPAMILGVSAAVLYAAMVILTRFIGRSESGAGLSFYSMVVFVVASATTGLIMGDGRFAVSEHASAQFLFRAWIVPTWTDFGLIAICGLIASIGFYCLAQAYRLSPSSIVAPFEYSALPWAVLWGFVFWDALPDVHTVVGILLVVGSGLYIIRRERIRGRRLVSSRPMRPRI